MTSKKCKAKEMMPFMSFYWAYLWRLGAFSLIVGLVIYAIIFVISMFYGVSFSAFLEPEAIIMGIFTFSPIAFIAVKFVLSLFIMAFALHRVAFVRSFKYFDVYPTVSPIPGRFSLAFMMRIFYFWLLSLVMLGGLMHFFGFLEIDAVTLTGMLMRSTIVFIVVQYFILYLFVRNEWFFFVIHGKNCEDSDCVRKEGGKK